MNDTGIVAERYAKTLFALGIKEKSLDAVESAFASFVGTVGKNRSFAHLMESPVISKKEKAACLEKMISKEMPALLVLFLKLVLEKKRFSILSAIQIHFSKLVQKYHGIHKAELITAAPVEAAAQARLQKILEGKLFVSKNAREKTSGRPIKVDVITTVDEKILGGFILKIDELIVDASYKTKLRELQQRLYVATV